MNKGHRRRFNGWSPPSTPDGELNEYNWLVQNPDGLNLGEYADIGAFTYINALAGVTIGDDVQIGSHCSIYTVSTIDDLVAPVEIGEGAHIGTHSTVMPGITIGEGATVGAHALVLSDVEPGETVVGVPARPIGGGRR